VVLGGNRYVGFDCSRLFRGTRDTWLEKFAETKAGPKTEVRGRTPRVNMRDVLLPPLQQVIAAVSRFFPPHPDCEAGWLSPNTRLAPYVGEKYLPEAIAG